MTLSPLPAKPKGVIGFDALATALTATFFAEKERPSAKPKQPNAKQAAQVAFKELKSSFRKPHNGKASKSPKTVVNVTSNANAGRSPVGVVLTPPCDPTRRTLRSLYEPPTPVPYNQVDVLTADDEYVHVVLPVTYLMSPLQ